MNTVLQKVIAERCVDLLFDRVRGVYSRDVISPA